MSVADALKSHIFEYYGVIGPGSSSVADFWAPIFHRLDLLTVRNFCKFLAVHV